MCVVLLVVVFRVAGLSRADAFHDARIDASFLRGFRDQLRQISSAKSRIVDVGILVTVAAAIASTIPAAPVIG